MIWTLLADLHGQRDDLSIVSILDLCRASPLLALVPHLVHMYFLTFLEAEHDTLLICHSLHLLIRHLLAVLPLLLTVGL